MKEIDMNQRKSWVFPKKESKYLDLILSTESHDKFYGRKTGHLYIIADDNTLEGL